jgi:MurNAc alpha-1-phosphate uridylyltransferase
MAHLVLTPRPEFRARGDFECAGGWITGRGDSYVYCGIGVWDAAAFAGRVAEHFSLRDVLFELVDRRRITAQIWEGYWSDIGTPEQLGDVNARHSGRLP